MMSHKKVYVRPALEVVELASDGEVIGGSQLVSPNGAPETKETQRPDAPGPQQ